MFSSNTACVELNRPRPLRTRICCTISLATASTSHCGGGQPISAQNFMASRTAGSPPARATCSTRQPLPDEALSLRVGARRCCGFCPCHVATVLHGDFNTWCNTLKTLGEHLQHV